MLQALDGFSLTDLTGLDRAEQGKEFIELHLSDPHVMQEVLREGPQLLRRLYQPLQHRVGVDLEDPRRAPDAQPLGQARDDPHDEVDRGTLAVKECTKGLEKVTTTDHTQQLPPGTAIGVAIGAEIAPAHPAPIGTVRVRAEVHRGVDLAVAPPCGYEARGWGFRGLWAGSGDVLTGVAVWLAGEARKRFRLAAALTPW